MQHVTSPRLIMNIMVSLHLSAVAKTVTFCCHSRSVAIYPWPQTPPRMKAFRALTDAVYYGILAFLVTMPSHPQEIGLSHNAELRQHPSFCR